MGRMFGEGGAIMPILLSRFILGRMRGTESMDNVSYSDLNNERLGRGMATLGAVGEIGVFGTLLFPPIIINKVHQ